MWSTDVVVHDSWGPGGAMAAGPLGVPHATQWIALHLPRPAAMGRFIGARRRRERRRAAAGYRVATMELPIEIVALRSTPETIAALAAVLVEAVAGGASVSFMHPLSSAAATTFWTASLAAADAGGRVVLGAMAGGVLAGTVTLHLDCPPNQPHRGEIAKLLTRVRYRRRGVARALMLEAERIAAGRGRTLLTLDTATDGGAGPLYERLGYVRAGVIPDFALKPHGGLCGTIIYWKRIGPPDA